MKLNNWFVIRADIVQHIGIGHAMRCLAFAEWAVDLSIKPILLCKQHNEFINKKINSLGGELVVISPCENTTSGTSYQHSHWLEGNELDDAELCTNEINKLTLLHDNKAPLFIMVDHYALAAPWEKQLEKISPVLVVDDLSDRQHDCTWLVDQTFGKTRLDYESVIPARTETFIGSEYALLRKEFTQVQDKRNSIDLSVSAKVLITLGGVDKNNDTQKIIEYFLAKNGIKTHCQLTVVTSSSNPNIPQLEAITSCHESIKLIIDSNNMALLMTEHDICIGAAGATSWERCAIGLPTITVIIAENQTNIAENLANKKAIINLGKVTQLTQKMLVKAVEDLINNKKQLTNLVINSRKVCDGYGSQRVLVKVIG